jgi:hypothetical protein
MVMDERLLASVDFDQSATATALPTRTVSTCHLRRGLKGDSLNFLSSSYYDSHYRRGKADPSSNSRSLSDPSSQSERRVSDDDG